MKKRLRNIMIAVSIFTMSAMAFAVISASAETRTQKEVILKMGTSKEGSSGYVSNVALARVATKYVPGLTYVSVPTAGSLASNLFFGKGTGQIDGCYPSTVDMHDMWHNIGIYKGKMKWLPYQMIGAGAANFMLITKQGRGDINCIKDLAGKKLYALGLGTSINMVWRLVLDKLGIVKEVKFRDMGAMDAADALSMGIIDAVGGYSASYAALSSWVRNIDARVDIKVVNPSLKEREIITRNIPCLPSYGKVPLNIFSQPVGVDKIWTFSIVWENSIGPNVKADWVYKMMKVWDEHTEELAEMSPALIQLKKEGLATYVAQVIDANPDIPVHPGTARFLKEKNSWKDTWTSGEHIELNSAGIEELMKLRDRIIAKDD